MANIAKIKFQTSIFAIQNWQIKSMFPGPELQNYFRMSTLEVKQSELHFPGPKTSERDFLRS